jgi:membrane-associated phospholipid phosphatase
VQDPRGLLLDHAAFLGAGLGRARVQPIADLVLGVVSIRFLLVAIAVAVVVALARGRWGDAVRAVLVAGGANMTTQILKAALERPDTSALTDYNLANSLPSGHTTVAASVVAMAMLVVPRALRPWAAVIGAAYVAATGVATMSLAWHRPSDALAAIAVVAAWTLLALVPARTRVPVGTARSSVRTGVAWLLGLAAGAGLAIAAATLRRALDLAGADLSASSAALDQGAAQLTFAGSAFGVVGAAALACWVVLLARR